MSPPLDLAALARELLFDIIDGGGEVVPRDEAEAAVLAKLESVATQSRTAGRADGYRAGYDDASASFGPIASEAHASGRAEGLEDAAGLAERTVGVFWTAGHRASIAADIRALASSDPGDVPERFMDMSDAGRAGEEWITPIGKALDGPHVEMTPPRIGMDNGAWLLWHNARLVAAAFLIRDGMNYTVLAKWRAPLAYHRPTLTHDFEADPAPGDQVAETDEAIVLLQRTLKWQPCLICGGIEGCDHSVIERARALADFSVTAHPTEPGERLTRERDMWRSSERAVSAAYVRLRVMLPGALDTPHAPSAETVWATTEAAAEALLAETERLRAIETAAKALRNWCAKSLNAGPITTDPSREAKLWRALMVALDADAALSTPSPAQPKGETP